MQAKFFVFVSAEACDDEGDVVLLGALQPAFLDTFRVTITGSSCLSLPRFEHFRNIFILASHVIIGFVVIIGFLVVVEFRNLRHVCVVRHALHETYENTMNCMNSEKSHRMRGTLSRQVGKG